MVCKCGNREVTEWVSGINMNIITVGSYPRRDNGDLEYDLGVTCIDELVCNLFDGKNAVADLVSGICLLDGYYKTVRT